jgi:protein-S-isoprenylcysteine O-methyltransferase Ste14
MNDNMRAILAALGASSVVVVVCALGYFVVAISGVPQSLGESTLGWVLGAFFVALGSLWAGWVFVYRKPRDFFVSTFYTFEKALTRKPPSAPLGRAEPFIVDGPYLYVRNPTYFGAIIILLGIGFIFGLPSLFVSALGLFVWFRLLVIPYEEKEMRALFGQDYVIYTRMVPAIIPSGKVVYGRPKRANRD